MANKDWFPYVAVYTLRKHRIQLPSNRMYTTLMSKPNNSPNLGTVKEKIKEYRYLNHSSATNNIFKLKYNCYKYHISIGGPDYVFAIGFSHYRVLSQKNISVFSTKDTQFSKAAR